MRFALLALVSVAAAAPQWFPPPYAPYAPYAPYPVVIGGPPQVIVEPGRPGLLGGLVGGLGNVVAGLGLKNVDVEADKQ